LKIDEIDQKIIDLLTIDGNLQNKKIADLLDVSEGTIRNRLKDLFESGYFKVKGVINPNLDSQRQYIFLIVEVAANKDCEMVAEEVSKFPEVRAVSIVTGRPDLIIEIFIEVKRLMDFLKNNLGSINSITSIDSLMVLKSYKKMI